VTQLYSIRNAIILLLAIIIAGTLGYHWLEGWSLFTSLYVTVVTLGTVGYGDYYPTSPEGRAFAILLIIIGVGAMAYTFALAMEYFLEGRIMKILGRGKVERQIKNLNGHYIVCGFGRMGSLICRELAREHVEFVVIEIDPLVVEKIEKEQFLYVKGSATEDKVLMDAGVERAKGIVCTLPTDAQNLYVILAVKEINPALFVLSRAEDEASERRLTKVGADRVMSPYKESGMKMAMAILKPDMLDFIELTTQRQSLELRMEEVSVCERSPLMGKTLEESGLRQEYGLIVVAVKKESGRMIFNPSTTYHIEKMDRLIALGEEEALARLNSVCQI
jgi:voltage-gated potassium channel